MKFEGIIPALVTPYDKNSEVNYAVLGKLAERLVREPIGGIFLCGSTGEWWYLTEDERMKSLDTVLQAIGDQKKVMVHVGAFTTRASQQLARHAEKAGAAAISMLPPIGFPYPQEAIWKHFKAVADVCSLPLYLYHLPQIHGDLITVDKFIEAMDTMPTLAGAKFSSYQVNDLLALKLKAKGRFNLLSGCGEQCLSATIVGADGSICTWYNAIPRLADRIFTCARSGNIAEALRCQDLLVAFSMILINRPVGNLKAFLTHRGYDVGQPRAPLPGTSKEEWAKLLPRIEATGIMEWCI